MTYKKILHIFIVFAILAAFWIRYTRYMDFGSGCFIRIVPAYLELSNANIKRAILILKNVMPRDYADLCRYVKVVDPSPSCGGFGGGCFYAGEEKKIYIQTGQNDLLSTAAVIVHEVCHAKQKATGKKPSETECYQEDDRVFKSLPQF